MTSTSAEETVRIAGSFIQNLLSEAPIKTARVVALSGNLGSGKTTFTQAVAKALGIEEQVTSPTFVIEKIYKIQSTGFTHLIHIDAYRIESPQELEVLGWKEIVADPHNLILIEWPERISTLLPPQYTQVSFTFVDDTTREIVWENISRPR